MAAELYSIGEVAELTGVPIKTIRYYADIGLLPPAATTPTRYRLYSAAEIWRLELVRTLRHVGFGLDEIQRILTGAVDVPTAIAWQLEALDGQIAHLTRLRDLLRRASADEADPGPSLAFLHDIGAAVTRSAEERGRFLASRFTAAMGGDAVPAAWAERMLDTVRWQLPADPTPDQAAAWAELIALLSDPEFAGAMQQHVAPFWETVREQKVDGDWWHLAMGEINERALSASRAAEAPDGPVVQAIARDWAGLMARAAGRPCDDAFLRGLARMAPGWLDERTRRIWDLLERAGWTGQASAQLRAQELVLDGLRAVVEGLGG
jgi:DNA-binding transcriptional MerR regulator